MGFRTPLTSASELDTGGSGQRVVITRTGGVDGGGAIALYPNMGVSGPGWLEAASDDAGAITTLSSPPNLAGLRSSLTLRGADVGGEGMYAASVRDIYLQPADGYDVMVGGTSVYLGARPRSVVPTSFGAGWQRYSTSPGANPIFQDLTFTRQPDGMLLLAGLFAYVGGVGAGALIYTLDPNWRPLTINDRDLIVPLIVNDTARTAAVDPTTGQITLRGALPAVGNYAALQVSWPGPDYSY